MDEDGGKPMETSIVWGNFRGNSMEIRVDPMGGKIPLRGSIGLLGLWLNLTNWDFEVWVESLW